MGLAALACADGRHLSGGAFTHLRLTMLQMTLAANRAPTRRALRRVGGGVITPSRLLLWVAFGPQPRDPTPRPCGEPRATRPYIRQSPME